MSRNPCRWRSIYLFPFFKPVGNIDGQEKMATGICKGCGFVFDENDGEVRRGYCPQCGTPFETQAGSAVQEDWAALDPQPSSETASDESPESHALQFIGSAREYFKIWAVNTCLTILTLGIYAAWAKVRTRQYFYTSTRLAGHPFYFLGHPGAILKGNIIIGAALLIYCVARGVDPVHAGTVLSLFYLFLPYLIYKSLRFNTRYSAFHNIRFGFRGTAAESYLTYLLFPSLIPFTLGIIVPYWEFRRKRYLFDNLAFGTTKTVFTGSPGYFYRTYIKIALIPVAAIFLLGIAAAFILPMFARFLPIGSAVPGWAPFIIPVVFSLFPLLVLTIVQQAIYAHVMNYCWSKTTLGNMQFESALRAWPLIWIRFSNILAVVFTAGLLYPWAKVRHFRYITERLTIISKGGLDAFSAAAEAEVSSLGDAATDFFDIGFGL
jgi:uncharacterized membrane protein YjgN (DUF898 family)/rubredoxin